MSTLEKLMQDCEPYDKATPWWKQAIGGAFCRHWVYGLVTGFFLGQAFILIALMFTAIARIFRP